MNAGRSPVAGFCSVVATVDICVCDVCMCVSVSVPMRSRVLTGPHSGHTFLWVDRTHCNMRRRVPYAAALSCCCTALPDKLEWFCSANFRISLAILSLLPY